MRRRLSRLAVAGTAMLAAVAAASPARSPVLYTGATIIDGSGAAALPDADLLVDGERIVAMGPRDAMPAEQVRRAETVDLHGRFIIPGLVDSHVHMATPPNATRARAMLRRDLYGGVTLVRDMADDLRSVAELARAAREGEIDAPDIAFAALVAGRPFFADPRVAAASRGFAPGTAPWMQAIDDRTDLREAVTLARGTGAAALKVYADLAPPLVAAVTAEAHRQHLLVWAHSAVFPTRPADVIASGADAVSHVCYLAYQREPVMLASYEDHTPVNEALLAPSGDDPVIADLYRAMLARGTVLDATGSLFVQAEAARRAHPEQRPLRCTGAAVTRLTRQAWRAGVPISTGTDHQAPASDQWPEVYDEIEFLARDVGMPLLQVIHAATAVGARAAGREASTGTIAPGKLANFVVLARDPLADIGNLRSIVFTVKRGTRFARADYRPVTPAEMEGP